MNRFLVWISALLLIAGAGRLYWVTVRGFEL